MLHTRFILESGNRRLIGLVGSGEVSPPTHSIDDCLAQNHFGTKHQTHIYAHSAQHITNGAQFYTTHSILCYTVTQLHRSAHSYSIDNCLAQNHNIFTRKTHFATHNVFCYTRHHCSRLTSETLNTKHISTTTNQHISQNFWKTQYHNTCASLFEYLEYPHIATSLAIKTKNFKLQKKSNNEVIRLVQFILSFIFKCVEN